MNQHYFTSLPPAAKAELTTREVSLQGRAYEVYTAPGVFSFQRLDLGTQVLLSHVPPPPQKGTFVDLGCGWGPITLALAAAAPQAKVWALDINERALDLTARNAKRAGLENVQAAYSDDGPDKVDLIWSNPPVRIGKENLHNLLLTWINRLSEGGKGYFVVQKNLGSDSLLRWLIEGGYDARKYASAKGYRIIEVCN